MMDEHREHQSADQPKPFQFRLSTLFWVTNVVACVCGFLHAAGVDGMLILTAFASIPFLAWLIAAIYVRVMSFVFDVVIGPFLLR